MGLSRADKWPYNVQDLIAHFRIFESFYKGKYMSEHHTPKSPTTPGQVVLATLGGLFAPLIAIYLIFWLVSNVNGGSSSESQILKRAYQPHLTDSAKLAEADEASAVAARIAPVGELKVIDANAPKVERTGEEIFNAVCTACHTPGALGAPKYGSKADWAPRIAQGYETLFKHASEGFKAMPARGGDPDIDDLELHRAIAYMANSAGAKFTPPEPAAAASAPAAK